MGLTMRAILLCLTAIVLWLPNPTTAAATEDGTIRAAEATLHLRILTKTKKVTNPDVHCNDAEGYAVRKYLPDIVRSLSVFSPSVFKKVGLKRVVLCNGLWYKSQYRSAIPDFTSDVLYLDLSESSYPPEGAKIAIAHELFHMIDFYDDGKLYEDKSWSRLNKGPGYGHGGKWVLDDVHAGDLNYTRPGFLDRYSTTGVEEDKATLFAYMISDYKMVAKRAEKDAILRAKMNRMRTLLNHFDSSFNTTFWQKRMFAPR